MNNVFDLLDDDNIRNISRLLDNASLKKFRITHKRIHNLTTDISEDKKTPHKITKISHFYTDGFPIDECKKCCRQWPLKYEEGKKGIFPHRFKNCEDY